MSKNKINEENAALPEEMKTAEYEKNPLKKSEDENSRGTTSIHCKFAFTASAGYWFIPTL